MKTLILIVSLFFGMNAFAGNSYCDTRPGGSKTACYVQAIDAQNSMIQTNMRELRRTMPQAQYNTLAHEGHEFAVEVNNRCTRFLVCKYDSLRNRNDYLADLRRKFKKK